MFTNNPCLCYTKGVTLKIYFSRNVINTIFNIKQNVLNIFHSHPLCILANIETFRVNCWIKQATLWNCECNCRLLPHLMKLPPVFAAQWRAAITGWLWLRDDSLDVSSVVKDDIRHLWPHKWVRHTRLSHAAQLYFIFHCLKNLANERLGLISDYYKFPN